MMPGMHSMMGMGHEHKKEGTPAHPAEEKVFDPVCDMEINKNTAVTSEYKGTTYYFCSKTCKANFEKEPDKFVTK
jgi:Cu2+-exporting ATPase